MKRITSGENQIYKAAAQLKQKKYRDEQRRYLIEGSNLIREAFQNGGEIVMMIRSEEFYAEDFMNERLDPAETDAAMAVMSSALFRKLSDTETPQGIMAIVKKRLYTEEEFFASVRPEADLKAVGPADGSEGFAPSNIVVLDRLQDPGNIGTILRTADAAGYLGAILLKGTADIYSPKIVRAAAGSLFRLPVLMADTPEQVIRMLRKHRKNIICTTPNCSRFYYDVDLKENAAVIIGNEGNGVCEDFLKQSDTQVKIPMEGTIESLNAAVSAGILMYESVRQRYSGNQTNRENEDNFHKRITS